MGNSGFLRVTISNVTLLCGQYLFNIFLSGTLLEVLLRIHKVRAFPVKNICMEWMEHSFFRSPIQRNELFLVALTFFLWVMGPKNVFLPYNFYWDSPQQENNSFFHESSCQKIKLSCFMLFNF